MKRRQLFVIWSVIILLFLFGCSGKEDISVSQGLYLGQKTPGMTPKIFAAGIVSTGYAEYQIGFTPDGRELYLWLGEPPSHCVILWMTEEHNRWNALEVCPFSGKYVDMKFSVSPDGNKFLFSSNRPRRNGEKPSDNLNIWYMERIQKGWGDPTCFDSAVNTDRHDYYPTMAGNGNLYFMSDRDGGFGEDDIYMSRFIRGEWTEAKNIGASINTGMNEGDPFIAPDESYIIFCSRDREEGFGNNDLYISFCRKDGSWTRAENMGNRINTPAEEVCPIVTHDGKYFFFSSNRKRIRSSSEIPLTLKQIITELDSPGNGKNDIYWVDARIIEELQPEELRYLR